MKLKKKDELRIEFALGHKHHYALGQEVLKFLLILRKLAHAKTCTHTR
jgi:hypothetical protein